MLQSKWCNIWPLLRNGKPSHFEGRELKTRFQIPAIYLQKIDALKPADNVNKSQISPNADQVQIAKNSVLSIVAQYRKADVAMKARNR